MDDLEAIRALIHEYAERLDAGDLEGVALLFEHATWRTAARPEVLRGSEQVRTAYAGVILYDGIPRTRHVISNVSIVHAGAPIAAARCYFTVLQAVSGFELQPILAGRYHDEFEQVDGEWRFTDRLILPDLVGDLSNHMRNAERRGPIAQ
ncbi:MAG: nuclear transport factor 2 family protein [Acidimicrobiia bacterium]